ncbi:MAG: hypothetical protein KBD78_10070 [Oligoflexales bacterium]|nr:hypothetical protein [Oligoflexales bacterium]
MPLYEYFCEACKQKFELLQKINDATLTTCTLCDKGPVNKLISKAAFVLKGTGWYETDFKGKKPYATPEAGNPQSTGNSPAPSVPAASAPTETAPVAPSSTLKKSPD